MSYDSFAHTFSESRKNHPWPELDYIIEDMKKMGFPSVLDIGCGNGRLLEQLRMKSEEWRMLDTWKYLGIDSSVWMIEEAKKRHPGYDFEVMKMTSIEIAKHFDVLLFLASFHHLETPDERLKVLQDIKPLLSPKGRVYMTNWNLLSQTRYEKSHRGNGDFDIKIGEFSRYYHGFTISELTDLFEKSGWKIEENRIFEGGRNIISVLSL